MHKFIALYKKPADPAAFDKRYFDQHIPLANKIPGLKKVEVSKIVGSPMGESEFMGSPEGKEAGKDVMSFAKDIVTFMFAEVQEKVAVHN
jgi:hypothetical protein